jgi:hypothetical protein
VCSNKKGSKNEKPVDPKALFNTYYPPCIYGKDSKKKAINSPCLPSPIIDEVTGRIKKKDSSGLCKEKKKQQKEKNRRNNE